jgi:hypothetical protein
LPEQINPSAAAAHRARTTFATTLQRVTRKTFLADAHVCRRSLSAMCIRPRRCRFMKKSGGRHTHKKLFGRRLMLCTRKQQGWKGMCAGEGIGEGDKRRRSGLHLISTPFHTMDCSGQSDGCHAAGVRASSIYLIPS